MDLLFVDGKYKYTRNLIVQALLKYDFVLGLDYVELIKMGNWCTFLCYFWENPEKDKMAYTHDASESVNCIGVDIPGARSYFKMVCRCILSHRLFSDVEEFDEDFEDVYKDRDNILQVLKVLGLYCERVAFKIDAPCISIPIEEAPVLLVPLESDSISDYVGLKFSDAPSVESVIDRDELGSDFHLNFGTTHMNLEGNVVFGTTNRLVVGVQDRIFFPGPYLYTSLYKERADVFLKLVDLAFTDDLKLREAVCEWSEISWIRHTQRFSGVDRRMDYDFYVRQVDTTFYNFCKDVYVGTPLVSVPELSLFFHAYSPTYIFDGIEGSVDTLLQKVDSVGFSVEFFNAVFRVLDLRQRMVDLVVKYVALKYFEALDPETAEEFEKKKKFFVSSISSFLFSTFELL